MLPGETCFGVGEFLPCHWQPPLVTPLDMVGVLAICSRLLTFSLNLTFKDEEL